MHDPARRHIGRKREKESRSIECNKYNYNVDGGDGGAEEDVFFFFFFPACERKTRNLLSGARARGRDRKASAIIINLADDDKNRAERQIIVASHR